jgi:hypothetical protein
MVGDYLAIVDLISGSHDGVVKVWNLNSRELQLTLQKAPSVDNRDEEGLPPF